MDKVKIVCLNPKCGYSWITKSGKLFVSCPNCLRKVRNEQRKKNEEVRT